MIMWEKRRSASRWEGLAFMGAYAFAIGAATLVFLTTKADLRSLGAWLVFIVFALCMTGILVLYRKAAKTDDESKNWSRPAARSDTSHCER